MAGQFCTKCGSPQPAGALFCASCGNSLANAPLPSAAEPSGPASSAPVDPAALRAALGLQGARSFLLQHQLLSGGRNYRVLNSEKKHLFTVREGLLQDLKANLMGGIRMREGLGNYLGGRSLTFTWTVADPTGNTLGTIGIEVLGPTAASTLFDANGAALLTVSVTRGMVGGLTASATLPDGRAMLEAKGNLLRHNFSIHDSAGTEVAKIHEAWASVRDTYNLDLVGDVDPLFPLIFAVLIDREKEAG